MMIVVWIVLTFLKPQPMMFLIRIVSIGEAIIMIGESMGSTLIPASEMKNEIPGTTDQTWAAKRHMGTGPRYVKLGRKVYYRRADVQAWIEANIYSRPDRPVV